MQFFDFDTVTIKRKGKKSVSKDTDKPESIWQHVTKMMLEAKLSSLNWLNVKGSTFNLLETECHRKISDVTWCFFGKSTGGHFLFKRVCNKTSLVVQTSHSATAAVFLGSSQHTQPSWLTGLTIVVRQERGLIHVVSHIHGLSVQQRHGGDLTVGSVYSQPVSRIG